MEAFRDHFNIYLKNSNAVDRYSYVENKIVSDCDGARNINEIEEIDIGGNLDNDIFIFEVNQSCCIEYEFWIYSTHAELHRKERYL